MKKAPVRTGRSAESVSAFRDFLRHVPRLSRDQESEYQASYYTRTLPALRLVSLLLAGLMASQTIHPGALDSHNAAQAIFWLCVFGLTALPGFGRIWQPALTILALLITALVLGNPGHAHGHGPGAAGHPLGQGPQGFLVPQLEFAFTLQMAVLMVTLSTLRMSFRWTVLLQAGILGLGLWNIKTNLPPDAHPGRFAQFILLPAIIVLLALVLAAFTQERLARSAFWSGYLLEEERNSERRQREQTEGQLQVLARAIGSIVHDLGSPMTVVQMGADILAMQNITEGADEIEAIQEAAQMLASLRISLIEQTRVLEGKSIPVDVRPEELRPIIEAGNRFQNSRLKFGRKVSLVGDDREIPADRAKLITVFMNLIGNALKYSDGDVRIAWRTEGDVALITILDQGTDGSGISERQARQLFVAFGRLEEHAQMEGTGLGLISALKVVEAHGGEVFIEGYTDGAPSSEHFTTTSKNCPSQLEPGFVTGFVVSLPLR